MNETAKEFEIRVRNYLEGKADWQSVHQLALALEREEMQFPPEEHPRDELQFAFLIDSDDDPQFRLDNSEIAALFWQWEQLRAEPNSFGREHVAERILREANTSE